MAKMRTDPHIGENSPISLKNRSVFVRIIEIVLFFHAISEVNWVGARHD